MALSLQPDESHTDRGLAARTEKVEWRPLYAPAITVNPVLTFDIETIPDIAGLRRLHDLGPESDDREVADMAMLMRRQQTGGSDFMPLHLHRIVTISCALREGDRFRIFSLSEPDMDEAELVRRFFDGIEKYTPQIVSWNGGGFDLPVLHYRGMLHGVQAPRYWDQGEDDRDFKWNNYISRYHSRHLDLMDLLALYQPRAYIGLDDFAKLLGFPGKLGMDGSKVWDAYQAGQIADIRDYCETDAANTYLVFLRFQLMRGVLTRDQYEREITLVRDTLAGTGAAHWKQFLAAWGGPA
jgi:predicted PolB exonuclease-like 3'-5' exonuclease